MADIRDPTYLLTVSQVDGVVLVAQYPWLSLTVRRFARVELSELNRLHLVPRLLLRDAVVGNEPSTLVSLPLASDLYVYLTRLQA